MEYQEEYIRRIHKVQDYMEQHLGEALSIETLSDVAGFSKYHFSRIFQSILHEPLAHYVNRIRMEQALFLLAHRSDKNMTDIAYELGFTDSAVFSRSFKNYYDISPREYRKEYSKNCKEPFLISEYNKKAAKKEWKEDLFPVTGQITITNLEEKQIAYDKDMVCQADHIIEIGPKAGIEGGTVVYQGDYKGYEKADTLFSQYIRCSHFGTCQYPLFKRYNGHISTSCYGWNCGNVRKWEEFPDRRNITCASVKCPKTWLCCRNERNRENQ